MRCLGYSLLVTLYTLTPFVTELPAQDATPESIARRQFNQVFVKVIMPVTVRTPKQDGPVIEAWVVEQLKQLGESEYFAVTCWVPVCDGLLSDDEVDTSMEKIIEDMENIPEYSPEEEDSIDHLRDLASEGPVIRLVNLLISRAIETRASDIHFEPFEDQFTVRYRIDGVLHNVESPPKRLQAAIVSRIKIMAKLNIAERRLPQDGRIMLRVKGKEIDFRVSSIPTIYGESLVLRILDKTSILMDVEKLGFPEDTLSGFEELIERRWFKISKHFF